MNSYIDLSMFSLERWQSMQASNLRPVARNFNWVVLLYKIVDLFNKIVDLFNKIVDLFGKIVDLLFERGVLLHLENPLATGLLCMTV